MRFDSITLLPDELGAYTHSLKCGSGRVGYGHLVLDGGTSGLISNISYILFRLFSVIVESAFGVIVFATFFRIGDGVPYAY